MSDPENYTVGWICALSTEQIAAAAFLDAEHEPLEDQPLNDSNSYMLGSIGKHDVVIAVLPLGEYGTASAATVATDLLRTFPNIRIGLLVGIGGGAPSERHDIRLGDVVVSDGGIFQYDFGKTIQGRAFQHTGFLNQAPTILRSAVASLKTKYMLDGHQLKENIEGVLERRKRLRKLFGRPKAHSDMLFQPNVVHDEGGCTVVCAKNESNLVSRCERTEDEDDPAVHHGLVASANQVMKNAFIRDRLSAEKDVLCFEMEAAGLMNNFPCLVIRGICDYSDSHKNKEWQGFAAMTAAAYAKDLLGVILPSKVSAEQRLGEALHQVVHTVANIEINVEDIKSHMISQQDRNILNWLADSDYGSQHRDYFSKRQQGTGQWFMESEEYKGWLLKNKQTLFCPGIPGAGKTILTAIVIEDLHTRFNNDTTVGIAYNYYNFMRQDGQTADRLMANLLRQLCVSQYSLPEAVKSLYMKHNGKNTRPSLEEIAQTLQLVSKTFSRVFIAIDALDECQNQERSLFLSNILKIQEEAEINIFATSRPISEIEKVFQGCTSVDVVASRDDIYKYIDSHMSTLPNFIHDNTDLKGQIKTEITNIAQGMFLLAKLSLGTLEDKVTPKEMKQALESFQKINQGRIKDQKLEILKVVYDETMKRIREQKPGFCLLAESTLSWLCHAKRQLSKLELQHALAVNMELDSGNIPREFDKDSIPEIDLIISSCCGLVTIDEESNVIRLVHYTTQEYFDRMRKQWFPKAETKIANVCTMYLTFDTEGELPPFYGYACMCWGYHACEADASSQIIHGFLANEEKVDYAIRTMGQIQKEADIPFAIPVGTIKTSLDLVAYFGAVDLIKKLPNILNNLLRPADLGSALYGALWNEQREAVRVLLNMGADLSIKDDDGLAPLLYAMQMDDVDIVQLLLNYGADPNARDRCNSTPLATAVNQRSTAMVWLLLEKGADFTIREEDSGMTAIGHAVDHGDMSMIRLFLEKITRPKQKVYHLRNVLLSAAVFFGRESILELIIERLSWPKVSGRYGSKLLYRAIRRRHLDIVELLVQKGAKVMQNGRFGKEKLFMRSMDKEWLAQKLPTLFTEYAG